MLGGDLAPIRNPSSHIETYFWPYNDGPRISGAVQLGPFYGG